MRRASIHPGIVLAVAAVGMLLASIAGPDFGRYRAWTIAFWRVDIFAMPSNVGSPLGLPVTTWSHGPGMLFTLPLVTLGGVVDLVDAPMVAGWASSLIFWWAFLRVLRWAARGNLPLVALGVGAAFLGTHAGFYTRAHASESFALVAVALLIGAVVDADPRLVRGCWLIGCTTALLLATRSYYAVYALPALAISADRIFTSGRVIGGSPTDGGASLRHRLVAAMALGTPILVAIVQQAFVNRWMTGSPRMSTYVYGDATYRSMDWLAPQFGAVLAHPWHGLLVYHPLYAIGFAAAIVCWWRSPARRERLLWAAAVAAVLVNLWVQAAWHFWWLGTGTFGMRGMAVAAVVLVPATVRVIADLQASETANATARVRGWTAVTVVACGWSLPLLMLGNTQLYDWPAVIEAQRRGWAALAEARSLEAFALAAVLVAGMGLWARRRHRPTVAGLTVATAAATLSALSLGHVMMTAWGPVQSGQGTALIFPALVLLLFVGSTFVLWRLATGPWRRRAASTYGETPSPREDIGRALVTFAVTGAFVLCTVLFARLAANTERRLASGEIPQIRYAYRATYQVQSAINSLHEYERIEGFDARKNALRRFLRSQGVLLGR